MSKITWSEIQEPTDEKQYHHITTETPLGLYSIEWKDWINPHSFHSLINDSWIATDTTLEDAKQQCENSLRKLRDKLSEFLGDDI